MTYTRKQVVTSFSVLYLIIATALAGYASSRATTRSVPISKALTGLTTALPLLSGLLLECGYDLTRREERRQNLSRGKIQRPPLVIIANTIIFIYSTVVITLLGTHAGPPSGLDCGLRKRWETMFKSKNAEAIRTIQDAFECCGLINSRDMAWPFPDKTHDTHACENMFRRNTGCMGAWKAEEKQIAGLLLGAVGMVFIWQFAIIAIPTQRESWLHKVAPDRISRMIADERNGGNDEPRRAIDYFPGHGRYSDRLVEEEEAEEEEENSYRGRAAIHAGNDQPHHASSTLLGGEQQPTVENEWARN